MKRAIFIVMGFLTLFLFGCSTMTTSMQDSKTIVNFEKADYEFSDPLSGEATSVKLFNAIDLARLFSKKYGEIQVVGGGGQSFFSAFLGADVTQYALYSIMKENPNYDIFFYPKYDVDKTNMLIISVTKVKATSRMARLKK